MSTPYARYGRGTAQTSAQVQLMLGEMADRLEANRPDEPITAVGRIALIQATTMDPVLSRALRERVPEISGSVVRRDYAPQLRQIAAAMSSFVDEDAQAPARELLARTALDYRAAASRRRQLSHEERVLGNEPERDS